MGRFVLFLGSLNFNAYNARRGGVTHDGKPTPPWDSLPSGVREGWGAGACAVALRVALVMIVFSAAGAWFGSMLAGCGPATEGTELRTAADAARVACDAFARLDTSRDGGLRRNQPDASEAPDAAELRLLP